MQGLRSAFMSGTLRTMIPVQLQNDSSVMAHRIPIISLCIFAMWCLWWLGVGAWHCFPNAEDLSLSVEAIEKGFLGSIQGLLISYDGRYFTNALHALNPLVWGWFMGYQLMPAIGILLVVLSFWFLLTTISTGRDWCWKAMLLSISYLMVHLSVTPSLSHDLYWMVSSFVYMWPWAFYFLFLGSMLRYFRTPEGMLRNMWFLTCAASLVCGIGMNEMFLVLYCLTIAIMALMAWHRGMRTLVSTAPLLVIGMASMAFFVSCPGIGHRLANQEVVRNWNHFVDVISVSVIHLLSFIEETWFGNLMVLPWAIVASILIPTDLRDRLSAVPWSRAVLYAVIGLCCLWAMTWAYYWPMGADSVAPRRVQTSLLYGLQIWTWGLIARVLSDGRLRSQSISNFQLNPLIPAALALVMCGDIMLSQNNITEIRREYSEGILPGYREQMIDRHRLLESSLREGTWNVAVVPPITHLPITVFSTPLIYPNRYEPCWNHSYEHYYRLDEVRLSTDTLSKLNTLLSDG
jgi:hypothetical protein